MKIKSVSTSFSILPNDFKKFAKAAFLKRVSFQIVPLQVVINCRTSEMSLIKQKIFFGIFKQETNISAITIAPALINGFLGIPCSGLDQRIKQKVRRLLFPILSSQKKRPKRRLTLLKYSE
jgi:hypothetical protein